MPVEEADEAEEAEEESSSTGSSLRPPNSSSSSSTSLKGTGGLTGKAPSFALANDFCRSLIMGWRETLGASSISQPGGVGSGALDVVAS